MEKAGIAPAFFDSAPSRFWWGAAAEDAPAIEAGKFRHAEQSVKSTFAPGKRANPARIPNFINLVPRYCRARNIQG
jgi:hypothetical protein